MFGGHGGGSSAVKETTIRAAIARIPHNPKPFDALITRVDARDACYASLMNILDEDPSRRAVLVKVLTNYVIGLVPSENMLMKLIVFCEKYSSAGGLGNIIGSGDANMAAAAGSAAALLLESFRDLEAICRTLLQQQPLKILSPGDAHGRNSVGGRGGARYPIPGHENAAGLQEASPSAPPPYAAMSTFQPVHLNLPSEQQQSSQQTAAVATQVHRGKRSVPMCTPDARECAFIAEEKNTELVRSTHATSSSSYNIQLVTSKDYIDQTPLQITKDMLDHQVHVLASYHDNYRGNPQIFRATSIMIKLMLDAWVAKLSLGSDYAYLREATIAFVPTFLKLLQGEYLCVQKHVYDLLLNLSVHAQLLDTMDAFEGFTAAVEAEIAWIACKVINRQVLLANPNVGDQLWLASLKCAMIVIPAASLKNIGARALQKFITLPGVATIHPHIFDVCCEALVGALLMPPPATASPQQQHQGVGPSGGPSNAGFMSVASTAAASQVVSASNNSKEQPPFSATSVSASIAPVNEEELQKIGGIETIVGFYTMAATSAARQHLFCIIFAHSATVYLQSKNRATGHQQRNAPMGNNQPGGGSGNNTGNAGTPTSPEAGVPSPQNTKAMLEWQNCQKVYAMVLSSGLAWDVHSLSRYQPHTMVRDLAQNFALGYFTSSAATAAGLPGSVASTSATDPRELKPLVMHLLSQTLGTIHATQKLPDDYVVLMQSAVGSSAAGSAHNVKVRMSFAKQCLSTIPAMLKEPDATVRRIGVNLAFQYLRLFNSGSTPSSTASNSSDPSPAAELIELLGNNESDRVRACAIDLLGSLAVLSRTQPQQANDAFAHLLKTLLEKERKVSNLMALQNIILHFISGRATPSIPEGGGDLNTLCTTGHLVVYLSPAEVIGAAALWKLYWALYSETDPVVCNARYVLVSVLSCMSIPGPFTAQIALWHRVLLDSCPAVAVVGSQNVTRVAGLGLYDHYEAAISEAQQEAQAAAAAAAGLVGDSGDADIPQYGGSGLAGSGSNNTGYTGVGPDATPGASSNAAGGGSGVAGGAGGVVRSTHQYIMAQSIWQRVEHMTSK